MVSGRQRNRLPGSRLPDSIQIELIEYFVGGWAARSAAALTGVNRHTAALCFHKLRELIAGRIDAAAPEPPAGGAGVEMDESRFGGVRKGKRGRGARGEGGAYAGGPCYIGNDIARRGDLWVAWVIEMVGDVAWTREVSVLRRATFAEQDAALDALVQRYRPVRVAMDQTGMGEKPLEDAKRRYGEMTVEGVLFSASVKLDMATILKERFEDRKIRIPAGDRELRADLHSVQKTAGVTGAPRLVADGGGDGHADRFWALALACAAAAEGRPAYGYRPAGRRHNTHTRDPWALFGRARFGRGTW